MEAILHHLLGFGVSVMLVSTLVAQLVEWHNRFISRRCNKPTYVQQAVPNDQTSCRPLSIVSESTRETHASTTIEQIREDRPCFRQLTHGVGALVKRYSRFGHCSTAPKIDHVVEANPSMQTHAKRPLASIRGPGVEVGFSCKIAVANRDSNTLCSLGANNLNNRNKILTYKGIKSYNLSATQSKNSTKAIFVVSSGNPLRSSKTAKVVYLSCIIKTVSATQIDNPDANSEPFPVLYVIVAGLIAFLILSLAIIIACVANRGSTASPATESFISISTTVLSVLEVVMLYRSEFFPKLCLFIMVPSSCVLFWALYHYWSTKLELDRRASYRKLCLPATLVFSLLVVAFLMIYNTFFDSLAAVPVTMPSSGWLVYTYQSSPPETQTGHELPVLQARGSAFGYASNEGNAESGHAFRADPPRAPTGIQ